jgi:hypothetical protein
MMNSNSKKTKVWNSVADPGCLSWIPDPDFIPDPTTAPKEGKNFFVLPFFVATKL